MVVGQVAINSKVNSAEVLPDPGVKEQEPRFDFGFVVVTKVSVDWPDAVAIVKQA